jgi:hypothetical protein
VPLCRALLPLSLLALIPCSPRPAFAQAQSSSADLKGTVLDPAGSTIAKAKLTITNVDRGIARTTGSGESGEFSLPLLPPGVYRLRVEAQGFTPKLIEGIELRVGDTVSVLVQMAVSAVSTEIEVQAEIPVVETERYQQANTIEQARIRDLPINRRNYLEFALLAPATASTTDVVDGTDYHVAQTPQSGISFGGGNGRGNGFQIDGVENYINTGGVRLSVSQEAVQEFQINRNTASVEFGWASGGTINIITKSGSNDYYGNVFGFLRNRAIQARNYFDPGDSAYTRSQAGATFGGRVVKDKTFFFTAYERLDRHETAFVPILQDRSAFTTLTPSQLDLTNFFSVSGVPALVQLGRQMNAVLTPANNPRVVNLFGSNSGTFPFSETVQTVAAKLDHRFSDRHSLSIRGNWSELDNQNSQFGALIAYNRGRAFDAWDGTAMLSDTMILGSRWFVETRAMFNYNKLFVIPTDPNGPEINIAGYGFFGREIFLPSLGWERHYQVIQNWNYHSGRHDIKVGFDINPVRNTVESDTFFSGRFNFGQAVPLGAVLNAATGNPNTAQQLAVLLAALGQPGLVKDLGVPITALQSSSLGLPTFYQQGFGNPNWVGWSKRYGVYAQDAWRVTPSFTLNAGVRYDIEVNEKVLGTDPNNVAPRVGFAWTPNRDQKFVVRGGYGVYFMPTNIQVANVADALSGNYINQVFVTLTGVGIVNPMTGRQTTSADIFQGLIAKGVIGTRPITAADIAPYGVIPGPGLPGRVVFGSDPVRNGYAQQGSFELERAFGDFAVSVGYNYNRTLGIARISGRNVYYTGHTRPDGSPIYGFFDPTILQKNIFTFDGNSSYHAGIIQVQRRMRRNLTLAAHYTWSKAIDDVTDFNSDFSPMDQLNKRAERAVSPYNHTHRVVFNALFESPARNWFLAGWNIAPIFQANSARPFNVLTGVDVNGDNYVTNDRPYGLGRDAGRGPSYYSFDLRLSRRFRLGANERRNLEFIAEGFNLTNHTNFRTVNNTVGGIPITALPYPITGIAGAAPTTPLAYTSAYDPRQFQFGLKINF